jgi:hypothetical protein
MTDVVREESADVVNEASGDVRRIEHFEAFFCKDGVPFLLRDVFRRPLVSMTDSLSFGGRATKLGKLGFRNVEVTELVELDEIVTARVMEIGSRWPERSAKRSEGEIS